MGYRIDYGGPAGTLRPKKRDWRAVSAVLLVALCVAGAVTVKAVGLKWVREVLLPGDPEITAAALETMAEDLREGESLRDALTAFCREIMYHGQTPE